MPSQAIVVVKFSLEKLPGSIKKRTYQHNTDTESIPTNNLDMTLTTVGSRLATDSISCIYADGRSEIVIADKFL